MAKLLSLKVDFASAETEIIVFYNVAVSLFVEQ